MLHLSLVLLVAGLIAAGADPIASAPQGFPSVAPIIGWILCSLGGTLLVTHLIKDGLPPIEGKSPQVSPPAHSSTATSEARRATSVS